jgi:hypothetical protein
MMRSILAAALLAAACTGFAGCDTGTPQVKTVDLPEMNPLDEAKNILTNYSNGSPMTSEAAGFPDLIKRAKEKDAAKGEILEKGLNEIKANPSNAKSLATELLKKL